LSINVEQLVADDDNVAIAYSVTGTHQGNFLGIPATGQQIKARGVQIA
jgi:predicted ester cyclase